MLQDTTDRNTSIPMSAHDRSSPFGGLFFSYRTVVILHRERPVLGGRSGGFSKLQSEILRRGFLLSPDNSELYLCPTNWHLSDKGPCSARPGVLPSRTPFEPILWILTEN